LVITEKEIRFRRAKFDDLPIIQQIERLSFSTPYSTFYMRSLLNNADIYYVAEYEGKIVGYIIARKENNKLGHIISIAVHPDYRRIGLGTVLMKKAEDSLRNLGCYRVYLEVRVSNKPAIQLYKKLGYIIVRTIPSYYSDGEDAFLMVKSLV